MNAFLKFNKGILKLPAAVRVWLILLVAANMVVPLFLLGRPEARVVLILFMASAMLMTLLTGLVGFTRLLGLGHILWIPLVYYLWTQLDAIPANDFTGYWIRAIMLLNGISLVLDAADVIRYVAGDRAEMVEEL
jgi:hypothetical protein